MTPEREADLYMFVLDDSSDPFARIDACVALIEDRRTSDDYASEAWDALKEMRRSHERPSVRGAAGYLLDHDVAVATRRRWPLPSDTMSRDA